MKTIIFALFLLCLSLNAQAQQTQHTDSTTPRQWVQLNSGTTQSLGGVSYPCLDTIWIAGGVFLRSTDGGITWLPFPHPGDGGFFQSSKHGISFTSGTAAYVTFDAGITWDTMNTQVSQAFGFCWASPDTCFVVGAFGACSTDGGFSWTKMTLPADINGPFNAISFCNSKVGYVVGPLEPGPFPYQNINAGACYKTTDGGSTWTQLFTAIQGDLNGVAVINPDSVIVIGGQGIYRTTDGGNSWNSNTPLFIFQTHNVLAANAIVMRGNLGFMVGAVAGGGGYIIHTIDAGTTWTQESDVNTPGHLYGVAILDDTDAIAVGDNGVILKRTNGSLGVSQQQVVDSLSIQIFPNPSQQSFTIQYVLPQAQNVTLEVFDVTGNLVETIVPSTFQNAGEQTETFSTSSLTSGNYFLQLISNNYSSSTSFIIN
jgi:photosystem II stability/assembly factor-like uncharacterized protein